MTESGPDIPAGTEPPVQRKRLGPPPGEEDRSGRSGCLIAGAVLGVIVGIMFALYGLKPILRHFYGEKTVQAGETYHNDSVSLTWRSVASGVEAAEGDIPPAGTSVVRIELAVIATEPWQPDPAQVRLQVSSQHDWLVSRPSRSPGDHLVNAGETRTLVFSFWVPPAEQPFEVKALHIDDPRLRMLPPTLAVP